MNPVGIGSPIVVVDGLPKSLEEHGWKSVKFRQAETVFHGSFRSHPVNLKVETLIV